MNKLIKLSLLASVLTIAACSNNDSASKESKLEPVSSADELPEKFEEPVNLSLIKHVTGDILFKDGETIHDNVHTKWAKDTFNIDLDYLWTTSGPDDTFDTKLQLSLSANEELPSIISIRSSITQDLIDSGRVMEVGEIFDKYASESWKSAIEDDPNSWDAFTRETGRYAIPILDFKMNNDVVLYIRQDWLDKLGLDGPETMDDIEEVMDAFVNEDPSGTGETTYGFATGFGNNFNTWMSTSEWVFGAYGAMPNQWNQAEDGSLVYGSVQPEMKQGLERMKEWMDKGYIHPESGLWDERKAVELFTSGRAGIIAGPHWMPDWPLSELLQNVDDAEYVPYEIPTGPDGLAGRSSGVQSSNGAIMINANATEEEIQAFFVYQNYLFDHYANPEEGSEFEYGFAEGYDYFIEGDEVSYRNIDDGSPMIVPDKYTITFDGARIPSLYINTLADFSRGKEPETPYEKKLNLVFPEGAWDAARIVVDGQDKQILSMFTGPPTPTMLSKSETINRMLSESYTKMVYGELDINEFDSIVEKWKTQGGDEITSEVNEWYEEVQKNRN
ncbi:sugar ABC transporter [Alkalicoccobacillus gibsonii]|uniref:sugar ABC transporter n=1 Tax=Alkalicoccobacillus gibsonii TaxID=79881 RepID=UPI003F7BCBEA